MAKKRFYAVAKGRKVGIYTTWDEARQQVEGVANCYKGFGTREEAEAFIAANTPQAPAPVPTVAAAAAAAPAPPINRHTNSNDNDVVAPAATTPTVATRPATAVVRPPAGTTGYRINELPPHRPITVEEVAKLRIVAPHFFAEPIDVYCDGSCLNNGTSNAVAGYGVFYAHPPDTLSADNVFEKVPRPGEQTNNRGELLAVIRVVEDFIKGRGSSGRLFPQLRRLDIKSDSTYMRKGYYEWMSGWIKNGWKLSGGGPVKNQDLFKRLEQVMKEAQIYFERVMLMHLEKAEEEEKREAARPASSKGLQSEGSKQDMIDVDAVDSDDELPTQRKRMETNGAPTSSAQYPIDNNGINAALNRRGDAGNPTPVKPLSSSSLHVPRFAEITYVAGHSNHPGNDAADELARKGAGLHYRT